MCSDVYESNSFVAEVDNYFIVEVDIGGQKNPVTGVEINTYENEKNSALTNNETRSQCCKFESQNSNFSRGNYYKLMKVLMHRFLCELLTGNNFFF